MPRDPNKTVKCPVPDCDEEFNLSSLRRHMKSKHAPPGPRVGCPHEGCDLDFKNRQSMKSHFKARHENREYPCKACSFVGKTEGELNHHKSVKHDKKYKCPYPDCPANPASKKNLIGHINASVKRGGHGGVNYVQEEKESTVEEVEDETDNNKRKFEELDPIDAFLESKKGRFKVKDPERMCAAEFCVITRLAWGFAGGDKLYCSKHQDDLPGLVYLGDNRTCNYINCPTVTQITIGGLRFCDPHVKQLISEGLPNPDESVKRTKNSNKRCRDEGCNLHSSFDDGKYCYRHSPTKVSDDGRMCEIPGCMNGRPTFGYPGETKTRCKEHKEEGMYSHKLCSGPECYSSASYGPPDGLPLTCVHHKESGYVNLNAAQCAMACCMYGDGVQAKFFHIEYGDESSEFYGKRICTFGRRVLIEDAIQSNDMGRLSDLMNFYELDRVTTLNAQSAFRFECEKKYHDRLGNCVDIVFDGHVHEGPKTLWSKRPDIFYKFNVDGLHYGIHIEYDEVSTHEDDPVRLKCIEENAGCEGRVYLIRVSGGHDTKNPACTRVDMANYSYHVVTCEGIRVASMVSDAVVDRIRWIEEGLGPGDGRPYKVSF